MDRTTTGGPKNAIKAIVLNYEGAKTTAIALAIACKLKDGRSEPQLLAATLPSFRSKPRDVLSLLSSRFPWLIPPLERLALIRNCEQHSTVVYDDEAQEAALNGKSTSATFSYDEIASVAAHFVMGMKLVLDVQTLFFAIGLVGFQSRYEAKFSIADLDQKFSRLRRLAPAPSPQERAYADSLQQVVEHARCVVN